MAKGYTKFDNNFLLYLSTLDLSGSEFRVLLFLLRQSACFKRQYTKDCSQDFIATGTGLCKNTTRKALSSLKEKGFIEICNQASGRRSFSYKIISDKCGNLSSNIWALYGQSKANLSSKIGSDRVADSEQKVTQTCYSNCSELATKEITTDKQLDKRIKREASPQNFFENDNWEKMKEEDFDEPI